MRTKAGVTFAVVLALAGALPGAARAQGIDLTCSLVLTKVDPTLVNVAYPDEAALYWASGYQAAPGARIRIQGRFPHSRYMSFNVYDQAQRPLDAIADAEIKPDPGSTNPFRRGANRRARVRSYTVFIEFGPKPARPEDRAPNTLYTGTGQNGEPNLNGSFIYRIYIPDTGRDETGGVGLPTATYQPSSFGPAPASPCTHVTKPPLAGVNEQVAGSSATAPDPSRAKNPPTWRKFTNLLDTVANRFDLDSELTRELGGEGGFLSNVHNAYVATDTSRQFGQVLVTRVRAPTFPDTRGGPATMPGGELRYFSMCQNHTLSQRFVACRTDDQSQVGSDGFITYVVSQPTERPATATAECGATWMPWGPFQSGLLILRNMLPVSHFSQAIQFAEVDNEVATMGDYFPVSRYYADAAAYDNEVGCRGA
jgi:hypothetical protein